MEYFKILNLNREPFSNSPEPDLFFQSPKHVRCLQNLELAIRLRRGLNVVLGHVGTGKTTLCRHLIGQFAETEPDAMEAHLLMDPAFSTPLEFLTTVAMGFGIVRPMEKAAADSGMTEWRLKESIKDYLFKKGVEEGKIVVLIIDEGQKMPEFGLEILREFLNYETNENKLLQIVIFAQPEFREVLDQLENVADRVNLLYVLKPLNFKETRNMIRFRLIKAGESGCTSRLFTPLGLLAIYWATGGYPRKIITLCHQAVLTMIIQNRSRAGWFLVRSCAGRLVSAGGKAWLSRPWRWVSVFAAVSVVLLFFLLVKPMPTDSVKAPAALKEESATQGPSTEPADRTGPAVQAEPQKEPTVLTGTTQKAGAVQESDGGNRGIKDAPPNEKPQMLGKLALKDGRTIWWMLTDLYGEYNRVILRSVAEANPHIKNLHRVQAGEVIHLPALPAEKSPLPANRYWIRIKESENLDGIYESYRIYKLKEPSLRFLPYWNPAQGMIFAIVMKDGFPDEAAARQRIARLPSDLASEADVFGNLERNTVFYAR